MEEYYSNIITYECTIKIIEQMKKNICKIKIGQKQGTGFFCKIPFPSKYYMKPVLITSSYLINEEILNNEEEIIIKIEEDIDIKTINLKNRMKYINKLYNIAIIELIDDYNITNYLELDERIINNKDIDNKNENIYIIQYPEGKLSVSYGIINNIFNKYKFKHNCSTKEGAIGSPILNMNNKVIGIHTENNIGIYLYYPIKSLH